jgi:hypothetical protein
MPAKPKRSKFRWFGFGALKGIGVWLLVIVILAIPAVWWLVQIPARNAKAFAACGEFSFSSPKHLGLTATSVKAVAAYGLTAKIKNIVELSVGVAPDFESIPLESQMLRLEDAADGNAPCACRKSNPDILMMQPAQDRTAKNVTDDLNGARYRCILF